MSAPETRLPYMPHLDGLRGIAVIGVLVQHFDPTGLVSRLDTGLVGVMLFFVLSGYLITRILLAESGTVAQAAASFYWRRFLRLAPAYYIAIFFAMALGIGAMRDNWPIHAAYLSNFQVAYEGKWNDASHFWSLAVEEQFYLLWFAVVVIAPRKWLIPLIIACLAIGPLFRAAMWFWQFNQLTFVLLPGCVDSLAAGAMLAVYGDRTKRWLGSATFTMAIAALVFVSLSYGWGSARKFVMFAVFANIASACAISAASRIGWLESPWLVHIGKISYGIYVFHYFVPQIVDLVYPVKNGTALSFVIYTALSLAAAELSWFLVENRLRAYRSAPMSRTRSSLSAH